MTITIKNYEQKRLKKIASLCTGKILLDIGYAQMPNPYYKGIHRIGLDLNKSNGQIKYDEEIQGDAANLKNIFENKKFDTIVLGELIEHIENPYIFLKNIKPFISHDGNLILSTPNPISWPVIFFEIVKSKRFYYSKDHLYYFTPRWMERMLQLSGYRVEKIIPVGFLAPFYTLPCPVWMSYQVIYLAKIT